MKFLTYFIIILCLSVMVHAVDVGVGVPVAVATPICHAYTTIIINSDNTSSIPYLRAVGVCTQLQSKGMWRCDCAEDNNITFIGEKVGSYNIVVTYYVESPENKSTAQLSLISRTIREEIVITPQIITPINFFNEENKPIFANAAIIFISIILFLCVVLSFVVIHEFFKKENR